MMKSLHKVKTSLCLFYIVTMVCMAAATIVEKYHGTDYAATHIYGAWWFCALWALLAALAVVYFVAMRVRRASIVVLHLSFLVILAGALLTHLCSVRGMIHLRQGVDVSAYTADAGKKGTEERQLPFSVRLNAFDVKYHEGTRAVQDYQSSITVKDGENTLDATVSMNNIFSYRSMRFYQASYDQDLRGSILAINSDPWGIPVTYTGYAMLFVSLLWMLVDPRGAYRRVLRGFSSRKQVMIVVAALTLAANANAATVLPKTTAEEFGRLNILYNDRICPLQTFAIDFTKKLYGSAHYKDYTPEQVLTGFIFWGDEWCNEPILKLKGGDLRETLQLPKYAAVNTFFNRDMGGYIIGPYVREYYQGQTDEFHKQVANVDDRLQLIMELRQGKLLRVFPYTVKGTTTWYAPTDKLDGKPIDAAHRTYINNAFSLIYQEALAGNNAHIESIVGKMRKYQELNAGSSLPTATQTAAERMYNAVPFATILFMLNLAMGFLTFAICIPELTGRTANRARPTAQNAVTDNSRKWHSRLVGDVAAHRWGLCATVMLLSFASLTTCLALRWIVSGTVPMANGYETMLFMAWLIMLCALLLWRKMRVILPFGFLMSGFFMLVSHINQMDPQISHIMPVLNSPLLCIHVSVIMMAFAMLSLTFVCGLTALGVCLLGGRGTKKESVCESLRQLSDLFLYPALAALGFGIFIGAIWANVSWGTYWSWDAKEVWGLITFMVYAISVHRASLPFLRRPVGYHVFMVLAFLTIIMTYFGVNYFLGGMHSYA